MSKPNRSKTKPASSARAAELVGGGTLGFVGFGGPDLGLLQLHPDLRALLRKLQKKDSLTKTKALRELLDMAREADEELVGQLLEAWPKPQARLALDGAPKVRQLTAEASGAIAQRAGRRTEPKLRALLPPWLLAQADPYPDVRAAATAALAATLPSPAKRLKATQLFLPSIVPFLADLVRHASPLTQAGPPDESDESPANRDLRLRRTALAVFQSLPASPELTDAVQAQLLGHDDFWKLAQHPEESLRREFFRCLACWMQSLPADALQPHAKTFVPAVVKSLGERSSAPLASAVWDCLLCVLGSPELKPSLAPLHKALLGKVVELLSQAKDSPEELWAVVGPCLGPLLSHLLSSEPEAGPRQKLAEKWLAGTRRAAEEGSSPSLAVAHSDCLRTAVLLCSLGGGVAGLLEAFSPSDPARRLRLFAQLACAEKLPPATKATALAALQALPVPEDAHAAALAVLSDFASHQPVRQVGLALLDESLTAGSVGVLSGLPSDSVFVEERRAEILRACQAQLAGESEESRGEAISVLFRLSVSLKDAVGSVLSSTAPSEQLSSALLLQLAQLWREGDDSVRASFQDPSFRALWGSPSLLHTAVFGAAGSLTEAVTSFATAQRKGEPEGELVLSETEALEELNALAEGSRETSPSEAGANTLARFLTAAGRAYSQLRGSAAALELTARAVLSGSVDSGALVETFSKGNEAALAASLLCLTSGRVLAGDIGLSDGQQDDLLALLRQLAEEADGAELRVLPPAKDWSSLVARQWPEVAVGWEWLSVLSGAPAFLLHSSTEPPKSPAPASDKLCETTTFLLRLIGTLPGSQKEDSASEVLLTGLALLESQLAVEGEVWPGLVEALSELGAAAVSVGESPLPESVQGLGAFGARRRGWTVGAADGSPASLALHASAPKTDSPSSSWSGNQWGWVCRWAKAEGREGLEAWLRASSHDTELEQLLLSCRDLRGASDQDLVLNTALAQLLGRLVPDLAELPSDQKDFLLCTLVAWLQSLAESALGGASSPQLSVFAATVFRLFDRTAQAVAGRDEELRGEWDGFFLDGCASSVLLSFVSLTKATASDARWPRGSRTLRREASAAVLHVRAKHVEELDPATFPALLDPGLDKHGYPGPLQARLIAYRGILGRHTDELQLLLAVTHLRRLETSAIVPLERARWSGEAEKEREREKELPSQMLEDVEESFRRLGAAVSERHLELGEGAPGESVAALSGPVAEFLGAWSVLLDFLGSVEREERSGYTSAVARPPLLHDLVPSLMGIVPQRPRRLRPTSDEDQLRLEGLSAAAELAETPFEWVPVAEVDGFFLGPEGLVPTHQLCSQRLSERVLGLEQWAARLLGEVIRLFPGQVRSWSGREAKGLGTQLAAYVERNLSGWLARRELDAVREAEVALAPMKVQLRREAREVVATYAVEDLKMELVVRLGRGFPLEKAVVEEGRKLSVGKERWRRWMLQLSVLLEGSVAEALLRWKRNVDSHLAGVEDCPVCMMAVHLSTSQLPKLSCRQCKNKFHAACLYKWFHSSNNTTCPLCRAAFS